MTNGLLNLLIQWIKCTRSSYKTNIDEDSQYVTLKMNLPTLRVRYVAASMRQSGYSTCERSHCIQNDVKQTWSVIKDTFKRNCIVHHQVN